MTDITNKAAAEAAAKELMKQAGELVKKAEAHADKWGFELQLPFDTNGYGTDLWYKPQASEGDEWSSSEEWESSQNGWVSSSSFC